MVGLELVGISFVVFPLYVWLSALREAVDHSVQMFLAQCKLGFSFSGYDFRADYWSLGVTLWYLIFGAWLFGQNAPDLKQILLAVRGQ